jgi:diguanylate cyclase (GGDEF)-like protein/PAS domain S-box-containing protein
MDPGPWTRSQTIRDSVLEHPSEAQRELLLAPAAILEGLPDAVVAAAQDEQIVYANALAEELFGYTRAELVGQPVQTLWPERVRERYTRNMRLYFATENPLRFSVEAWGLRRDGSQFIGEMSWGIVTTNAGPLLLAIGRDITVRRDTEARQREVAGLAERALGGADAVSLAAEAVGMLCTRLPIVGAEVRLAGGSALAGMGAMGEPGLALSIGLGNELLIVPERELADDEMSIVRAVAHTLATALARLHGEERIRHEAVHDPLTGLANRTLLRDRLEHALAKSERLGNETAVLFVDLDNFKEVNDRYGHGTGDAVLRELGRRLRTAIRPGDTVARFGGDEFVAVCEDVDEGSVRLVGQRILEAIKMPIRTGAAEHWLSASVGIALGGTDPDVLMDNADVAAYRAKSAGGGHLELFG